MGAQQAVRDLRDAGQQAKEHPVVDRLARLGFVAYGVVYLVLGWLALQLSLGDHEAKISKSGAFHELAQQPLGRVALWFACVGLAALVLWQGLEAAVGGRGKQGAKRVRSRLRAAFRAVVFGVLSYTAATVALGNSSSGGTDGYTARLMRQPAGPWLVAAVGVGVLVFAFASVRSGVTDHWRDDLDADGRSGATGTALTLLARLGYCSRGVAFGLVGSLFIMAAVTHDADKSGGLDAALGRLLQAPLGPWLLAAVAVGFACYGAFNVAKAKHLRN